MAELALGARHRHRASLGPKTVFIATVSAASPSGVLVPWALMCARVAGIASARHALIARAAPAFLVGRGDVRPVGRHPVAQ